jgi:CRP-like cAMP-binding protein
MKVARNIEFTQQADARTNHLLASLSADIYARLETHLEYVFMPKGAVLHAPGSQPNYFYFPVTSIVSTLHVAASGDTTEINMVGRDGMVGMSLLLDGDTVGSRAMVLHPGHGYRIKTGLIRQEFARGGQLHHLTLRYIQAMITQMAQTVVCVRHHSVEQQLCRLLLTNLDHVQGQELLMTQELIATLLGVRREGVAEAACKLRFAGMIRYSRGHITIVDRQMLEHRTCDCYRLVKREYERLLQLGAGS